MAKTSRPKSTLDKATEITSGENIPPADEVIESAAPAGDPEHPDNKEPVEPAPLEDAPPVIAEEPERSDDPATASEPVSETAAVETKEVVRVEKRGGFLGMVAGGVVAAAAGYAVATYFPMQAEGPAPQGVSQEALGALQDTLSAQSARLDVVQQQLAARDDLAARLSALEERPLDAEAGVDLAPLQAAIDSLAQRISALESLPTGGGEGVSPTLMERLGQMEAEIEGLKGQGETAAATMAAAAAEAEARLAEAEARAEQLKAEAEETARKALQAAAIGRVRAAMESGAPFTSALDDLQGVTIPDSLIAVAETGVPTVNALAEAFPAAAREALDASRRATVGDSMADRFSSLLQTATGARSLAPREGTDPDAVLSRAEASVKAGDLEAGLAEIQGLPPEGQAELAAWIALAQTRIAALAGLADLSAAISQ